MTSSKPTGKAPAKRPAAARKAATAARSATARAKTAAAQPPEDGEALAGRVIPGGKVDVETGKTAAAAAAALDRQARGEAPERTPYHRPDRAGLEVSEGLSFTSTVKDRDAEGYGETRVFDVDGELYVMVRPIDDAFVLLTTAAAATTPMPDRVAAILEFLAEAVDEGDQIRLRARMKDPNDDFGFLDLLDILERVVETFTKNKGPKQARAMAAPARR